MQSTSMPCAEDAREQNPETKPELPDDVADAWAAVLIDIYEKRQERAEAERGDTDAAA